MYRSIDHSGHLYLSLSIQPFPVELLKNRISACVITGEAVVRSVLGLTDSIIELQSSVPFLETLTTPVIKVFHDPFW